jgi:hypothetical protein
LTVEVQVIFMLACRFSKQEITHSVTDLLMLPCAEASSKHEARLLLRQYCCCGMLQVPTRRPMPCQMLEHQGRQQQRGCQPTFHAHKGCLGDRLPWHALHAGVPRLQLLLCDCERCQHLFAHDCGLAGLDCEKQGAASASWVLC